MEFKVNFFSDIPKVWLMKESYTRTSPELTDVQGRSKYYHRQRSIHILTYVILNEQSDDRQMFITAL